MLSFLTSRKLTAAYRSPGVICSQFARLVWPLHCLLCSLSTVCWTLCDCCRSEDRQAWLDALVAAQKTWEGVSPEMATAMTDLADPLAAKST